MTQQRAGEPARHAARVPLLSAGDRRVLRFAAWFLGLFAAVPLLYSPVVLLGLGAHAEVEPPGGRAGYVALLVVSTLFFGLPALLAAWQLRAGRPEAVLVIDGAGLRTEARARPWSVDWSELNGVALSIRYQRTPPRSLLYLVSRRFRERRSPALLFAPRDPEAFQRRGLIRWHGRPGWTAAMPLHDSFPTDGVDLVDRLAAALEAFAPAGCFAGVWHEGRPSRAA